jgi:hypothetical protein
MEDITAWLLGAGVLCVSLYRGADLADKYLPMTSFWKALLGSFGVWFVAYKLSYLARQIALWLF